VVKKKGEEGLSFETGGSKRKKKTASKS